MSRKKVRRNRLGQAGATAAQVAGQIPPWGWLVIFGGILYFVNRVFGAVEDFWSFDWFDQTGPEPPDKPPPLPGAGLPPGWTPDVATIALYTAMKGLGTDYDLIISTLNGLSSDPSVRANQLVAIYNEFKKRYWAEGDGDLFQWFADDLSGEDLAVVLAYWSGTGLVTGKVTPPDPTAKKKYVWHCGFYQPQGGGLSFKCERIPAEDYWGRYAGQPMGRIRITQGATRVNNTLLDLRTRIRPTATIIH